MARHGVRRRSDIPLDLEVIQRRVVQRRDRERDASPIRLINASADGIPGLVIEQFADVHVAQVFPDQWQRSDAQLLAVARCVMRACGARAVYRKEFVRDRAGQLPEVERLHTDPVPWIGVQAPEQLRVVERGRTYLIRPYDGYSVGLFLEHRLTRDRVQSRASGRRVLNTFAYTCGFSIAAALGGATETVSVDVSKKYLAWGRENFAANSLSLDQQWFVCDDVLAYFARAQRQGRRFDMIILDPPTFGRSKQRGGTFSIARDLNALLAAAFDRLDDDGEILLSVNHRQTSQERLREAVEANRGARAVRVDTLELPADFVGDSDYSKQLWLQVGKREG